VVVFPYRSATASGVLALAQSLARPVVATAVGGLAEAVEPGVTGLLVPPGDPDALARALEAMLADPEVAAAMGARGHEAATGARSWDAVAARLEPLLAPQAP
jgi:glycosyltransferase involved in cell wall biosynthesis